VALNTAHLDGSLQLAFQPIVSAENGHAVQAFEALLRWQCPGFGAVSPVEFIALAEESERILVLGRWVLQQACEQAVRWQLEAEPAPKVAVNTSIHQLVDPAFSELVRATLRQTGLVAERLVIEVTESVFDENNSQQALSSLLALHHLGVEIHIDDFGTGYSSLSRLREFPLNAIKIDKSFVLHQDERSLAVIEGAVLIAHRFGLRVIAEGIETAEQATRLAGLGVDEFQGYHFGRPAPQAAEDWVAQRAAVASGAGAAQV
jgi:EAL domain-containing protein (putative c-di-GMP-specific phosphodiesterase class I)